MAAAGGYQNVADPTPMSGRVDPEDVIGLVRYLCEATAG
jgi:hypothetical protein